jgi:hypothetical protein
MTDFPHARCVRLPERQGPLATETPAITLAVHEAGSGPAVVMRGSTSILPSAIACRVCENSSGE